MACSDRYNYSGWRMYEEYDFLIGTPEIYDIRSRKVPKKTG